MDYRWIEDIEDFRSISSEWDRAVLGSDDEPNPFLLSDFLIIWWRHFGRRLKLRIFIAYDGKSIKGGLPLCQNVAGRLEHIGGINANYTECFWAGDIGKLWRSLFKAISERRDWRVLQLKRYRRDRFNEDKFGLKRLAAEEGLLLDLSGNEEVYMITVPRDISGLLHRLPKKLRYLINRSMKAASERGGVALEQVKARGDMEQACDELIHFSRESFARRGREKSAFEDRSYRAFFEKLMEEFYLKGRLDCNVLKIGGKPAAVHFGYLTGRVINYVFTAYDPELSELTPGHLLIYKLLELGSKRQDKYFDFFPGYQMYKKQWSDTSREVVFVEIRRSDLRGKAERIFIKGVRNLPFADSLKRNLKKSAVVTDIARKIKGKLKDLT